jgi:hypothetical protein
MQIRDRGVVFLGAADSEYASACFSGPCVLPSGRWLVAFRAAPRKSDTRPQRVVVTVSDDAGRSWRPPVEPFARVQVDGRPGDWRCGQPTALGGRRVAMALYWVDASNPSLSFYNAETEGLLDSYIFQAFSDDDGDTWGPPQRVDTSPYHVPTPITGPMLRLPDGCWAIQFETNKTYLDRSPWHHQAVLLFSGDGGKTWPEHVDVGSDPTGRVFYWDQRPAVLADGSMLALFWTFDRQTAAYRNIHARASRDSGRTWGPIWDTGVPGQPAPAVSLPGGRVAMVYVDRERVPLIKLRASADGGRTWPASTELVLDDRLDRAQQASKGGMDEAWSEMAAFSLGLPQTAALPGGEVLVVYYAGPKADHTGLYWVRVGG